MTNFTKKMKFMRSPVIYQGRGIFIHDGKEYKPIAIDVRQFVQPNDFFLKQIVKDEGIWDLPDNDSKVLACLKFVRKYITYTPDKVEIGVNEFWTFPNETLALGKGDCFAGYEEIYTENGLKKISDIKKGDMVLSYDFEKKDYVYKPVVKMWSKGKLQVNRVHFRNGQWMDVSENHPMWHRHTQKTSTYKKQYLSEIDLTKYWTRKVPIAKKIPYKIQDVSWLTEELCLVLGHFLAKGWVRQCVTMSGIAFSSGQELNTHIKPILEKYNIAFTEQINATGVPCIKFVRSKFNDFLCKQLTDSFSIHLEEWILHLPPQKLEQILYGYWLGDGTKVIPEDKRGFDSNKKAIYSTSSKQFADDIQRIGLQLGRSFHIWKQKKHDGVGTKPIYRITYNTNSYFLKNYGYKDISEVSISKIEKLEPTTMYDLTVADTHTVVMKNGVITHQCEDGSILLTSLARNAGVPANLLRICAGWVVTGQHAPLGGHAYTIYKASDGIFRAIDWCYRPNNLPILKRTPFFMEPYYKDIWFSFNDKGSWSKNRLSTTIIKSCKNTGVLYESGDN